MKMKKQNHKDSNSQTSVHYANVATAYNQAFFHEDNSDYQRWQLGYVLHHLRLQPTDQVVDLGCGTGVFTEADCNSSSGKGTCKYPNEAECSKFS